MARYEKRNVSIPGRSGQFKRSEVDRCWYCNHYFEKSGLMGHMDRVCPKRPNLSKGDTK